MNFEAHHDFAVKLDNEDPLRSFREQFIIPNHNGKEQVYFLGNSLGLQPKSAKTNIDKVLGQWSDYGVEAFFLGDDPWMNYHDHLLKPLGKITGSITNRNYRDEPAYGKPPPDDGEFLPAGGKKK